MKFTLRLVSALWLSVMLVIGAFAYLQIREERERLVGDLQRRAILISEGLSDAIEAAAAKQSPAAIERIVKKFGQSQRGIAVYDRFANRRFATPDIAPILPPSLPEVTEAISRNSATQGYRTLGDRALFIYATPLIADDQPVGAIAVLQDASHLERAEWDRWSYNAVRFLVLALRHLRHHRARGEVQHHPADGGDLAVDAGAPQRTAGPAAAQRRRRQHVRPARARGLPPRAQHAAGPGRGRAGGRAAAVRREHLDRGAPEAVRPDAAQRPAIGRGVQPRAGEPRVAGRPDPRPGSGQRPGDRDGSGDARLRRCLGRARQRRRRPGDRGRPRPHRRAARRSALHAAAGVAHEGGRAGLLLRLLERGAVAALPHRPHAPGVPARRLGVLPAR